MGKVFRYVHGVDGSKKVEKGSKEHKDLLESGVWFDDRSDVPNNGEGIFEGSFDVEALDVTAIGDDDLEELAEKVDLELAVRGLEDKANENKADVLTIPIEARNDDELREIARAAGIKGYTQMKRETLIKRIKDIEDD